jgi:hypothetical protein
LLSEISDGTTETRIAAEYDKLAGAAYTTLQWDALDCVGSKNPQNDWGEREENGAEEAHTGLVINVGNFERDLIGKNRVNLSDKAEQQFG